MEENNTKTGGNKGMMYIIMGMLGLIILALAAASVFLIINMDSIFGNEPAYVPVEEGAPPDVAYQEMFSLSSNVLAMIPSRPGGNRVTASLSVTLGIDFTEQEEGRRILDIIADREAVVVDTVHNLLRQTTAEEIEAPGGTERLREDILHALQILFNTNLIVSVFMTHFIM